MWPRPARRLRARATVVGDVSIWVRIAPTNDRSIVGVMNEFALLGEHRSEGDLTALSLRMAGTPVGPLRAGDRFPDRALAALVGELAQPADGVAEVIPFPGMERAPATSHASTEATNLGRRANEAQNLASGAASAFQLKVTLLDTKPPIWRRILVDGSISLDGLHEVIQAGFGWWNCRLHEFEIGRTRYGIPDPDWDFGPTTVDERTVRLDAVAAAGSPFHYTYDFGDDWRHKVVVEKVGPVEPGTAVPACVGGRRACPPEDCCGPWGYQDLLESLGGRPGASDARLDVVGPSVNTLRWPIRSKPSERQICWTTRHRTCRTPAVGSAPTALEGAARRADDEHPLPRPPARCTTRVPVGPGASRSLSRQLSRSPTVPWSEHAVEACQRNGAIAVVSTSSRWPGLQADHRRSSSSRSRRNA